MLLTATETQGRAMAYSGEASRPRYIPLKSKKIISNLTDGFNLFYYENQKKML